MTMYPCHCGSIHDSAAQGPCPVTVSLALASGNVRAVWTTELDRFLLAAALRARHPHMSKALQALHDRLLPTEREREYGREFAEFMAQATPEERAARLTAEERRCADEDAFVKENARP